MVARPKSAHALGARFIDGGLFEFTSTLPVTVGIDQSLTNFAVTALHSNGAYFTWCYTSKLRDDERLRDIERFLADVVIDILPVGGIAGIAMEGYASNATFGRESAGELGYAVRTSLWKTLARRPLVVAPTALKKYATSRGNAKKNEILLGVYKHWGVEFTDDNMADSFVLANIAGGYSKYAYQSEVLAKLEKS